MASSRDRPDPASVQSVARALDLLDLLGTAGDGDASASDLSRASGLPYATTHRLLGTLAQRGYVRQDPASRAYSLGPRLALAGARLARLLARWVQPYLVELAAYSGETANVAVLDAGYVTYVAQEQSTHQLRAFTEVGNRVLPHATAVGKVLLARTPRGEVEATLQRNGLPACTPRTITRLDRFTAELDRVAAQGFAVDDEETELGVRCVAVPLVAIGNTEAALSVSGPAGRLDLARQDDLVAVMQEVAARFAASLRLDAEPGAG